MTVETNQEQQTINVGFQKGNQHGKVLKAGKGTGRKPGVKTQAIEFEKTYPNAVYDLLTTLYNKGLDGDKDSAIYVIDRLRGRPSSSTDLRIKGQFTVSPEEYKQIGTEIYEIRNKEAQFITDNATKLLKEGDPSLE